MAVGWGGFAILCLYVLAPFLILGAAWYVLLRDSPLKDLRLFVWARMVRDAATEVLPFSQVGGIVIGARAAILHGISQPLVFASVIVDVTTEMLAQIAYIALGVAILSARVPRTAFTHSLTTGLSVGLAIAVDRRRRVSRFAALQPEHDGEAAVAHFPGRRRGHCGGNRRAECDLSLAAARRRFRGAAFCRMDRKRRSAYGSPFA